MMIMRKTPRTHGHEFTPENTYLFKPYNWRDCRTCAAIQARIRRARLRAASVESTKLPIA